jgi:hypothetical protein
MDVDICKRCNRIMICDVYFEQNSKNLESIPKFLFECYEPDEDAVLYEGMELLECYSLQKNGEFKLLHKFNKKQYSDIKEIKSKFSETSCENVFKFNCPFKMEYLIKEWNNEDICNKRE